MQSQENVFQKYFGVVTQSKTYLNLLYLLLAFPLGLTYFIFLVVGFSLGLSLIIIWIGLVILAIIFPIIWLLILFERGQAIYLLKENIPPMEKPVQPGQGLWQRVKEFFTNPVTWKGLLFLVMKFPLGLAAFIMLTVGLSVVGAMITAPITYQWAVTINFGFMTVDTLSEALSVCVLGILLLPAALHTFNFFADLNGKLARVMLGQAEFVQSSQQPTVNPDNQPIQEKSNKPESASNSTEDSDKEISPA